MDCEKCKNEQRIIALEKDSERNQTTHKEYFNKFETLSINSAVSDKNYENIMITLSEVKKTVDELAAKPSKRWESIIAAIITAVIGGVVGFLIKS